MKNQKTKNLQVALLMLIVTFSATIASMQFASSAPTTWETFFHVMIAPNPVGIGQPALVTLQVDRTNPLATVVANNWQGLQCKITKPDGKTEMKGPYTAYSIGNIWFTYTPTMEGTYTFEGSWPGQWVNTTGANAYQRWYTASSATATLVVQRDPIATIPNNPLPTGYWTRPIYGENKGWNEIADNWLMPAYGTIDTPERRMSVYAPYTTSPESPHVLWKKPIAFGGIAGAKFGDKMFYTGSAYELHYAPLILSGRIIYREHTSTSLSYTGTRCLDLYTGEEIWYLNNTNIAFAQTLDIETPNEHGILAYLWSTGTNWTMYDAYSGRQILTLTNMPSGGKTVFGPNGEILIYILSGSANTLTLWNSTRAIMGVSSTYRPHQSDTWSPSGTVNASRAASDNITAPYSPINNSPFMGVEWNVTIPDVPGSQSLQMIDQSYIMARYTDSSITPNVYEEMAYPAVLSKNSDGNYPTSLSHLWIANRTNIRGEYRYNSRTPLGTLGEGVYIGMDAGTLEFHGYSIITGQELWVTEPLPPGWSYFTYIFIIGNGKFYTTGYDGHVRAWSITDGSLLWDYYLGNSGFENAYGTYPIFNGLLATKDKIFVSSDEHSADSIPWRGGKIWCIDADTGKGLWNMSGWMKVPVISDGIATAVNNLDMQIYTIGKGQSATTVEAPLAFVPLGSGVTIVGKVTDLSPAQKGTPAISDENMSAWMEYLHMQKPMPTNAKGVNVTLSTVDPNGNSYVLGDAISDISGSYGFAWTPEIEGTYQITATFAGTNSYGSSYDTTYLTVGPAAAQPTEAPTQTPIQTETPLVTPTLTPTATVTAGPEPGTQNATITYVAIAAVIVITAIVAIALFLRKRR